MENLAGALPISLEPQGIQGHGALPRRPRKASLGVGYLTKLLEGARVVDVRDPGEYFGAGGHVPRSELVPLPDLSTLCRDWDQGERIVILCQDGHRSGRARRLLRERGFRDVHVLPGGLDTWAGVGLTMADRACLTEGALRWSL